MAPGPIVIDPGETHVWRVRIERDADQVADILARYAGPLAFSTAQVGADVLVAVTRGRAIGVSLEDVRGVELGEREIGRIVSDRERRAIDRLPPGIRDRALCALKVQHDAYAKARGDAGDGWSLRMLDVGPGFAAALVVEGAAGTLRWPAVDAAWTRRAQPARSMRPGSARGRS